MKTLVQRLVGEEYRNMAGAPRKFQLIDFLGTAYGAYFVVDGWRSNKVLNVMIGSTMLYIHSLRFWYAPQGGEPPQEEL